MPAPSDSTSTHSLDERRGVIIAPGRIPIHDVADYGERLVSGNRPGTILDLIQERGDSRHGVSW